MRKVDKLFGKMAALVDGNDKVIGDHIIDAVGAHRAGITKISDLDRRRAACHDFGAGVLRVAFEVDENIDSVVANPADGRFMRHGADIDKMIEGSHEARADFAPIIDAVGISENFKALMVVMLQHLSDEESCRMLFEVAGKIADADAPGPARGWGNGVDLRWRKERRPIARAEKLLIGRRVRGDEGEGRDPRARPHQFSQFV